MSLLFVNMKGNEFEQHICMLCHKIEIESMSRFHVVCHLWISYYWIIILRMKGRCECVTPIIHNWVMPKFAMHYTILIICFFHFINFFFCLYLFFLLLFFLFYIFFVTFSKWSCKDRSSSIYPDFCFYLPCFPRFLFLICSPWFD